MKEIKDSNKNQNEQNKNEIKEEEHSELFNHQKEEKNFTFENYDLPKNAACLKNNDYYKK